MAEKRRKALYEALKENEKVCTQYNLWHFFLTFQDYFPSAALHIWLELYKLALILV